MRACVCACVYAKLAGNERAHHQLHVWGELYQTWASGENGVALSESLCLSEVSALCRCNRGANRGQ